MIFPHDQLQILSYNRVVADLHGHAPPAFIEGLKPLFEVKPTDQPGHPPRGGFDLYVGKRWHRAAPRPGVLPENDPVRSLAVSVLAERVLGPLLGIVDQRTDHRIDFVGGIRGVDALVQRVDSGLWAAAFWL